MATVTGSTIDRFPAKSDSQSLAGFADRWIYVFMAGLFIAGFVAIPILNLATPLFGMALMVHVHKRLTSPRGAMFESAR